MGWTCSTHGEWGKCDTIFGEKTYGKRPFGRLCVDERIILKRVLEKYDFGVYIKFIWLTIGSEFSGSTKGGQFID